MENKPALIAAWPHYTPDAALSLRPYQKRIFRDGDGAPRGGQRVDEDSLLGLSPSGPKNASPAEELRPLLGTVQNADNLYGLVACTINNQEWKTGNR